LTKKGLYEGNKGEKEEKNEKEGEKQVRTGVTSMTQELTSFHLRLIDHVTLIDNDNSYQVHTYNEEHHV
jgi:hypothetical protein